MIRPIGDYDYEKVRPLLIERYGNNVISEVQFKDRIYENKYFVLEHDDTIIGIVKCVLEVKLSPDKKYVGHIEDLFVMDNYRKCGFGYKLADYSLNYLKDKDCYKIVLDCKSDMIGFYNRLGFTNSGANMCILML
jgi:glucosamine-phosphate N-acetyltransferase